MSSKKPTTRPVVKKPTVAAKPAVPEVAKPAPFGFNPQNYDLNSPQGLLDAQTKANQQSSQYNANLNRINETNPFGTSQYKQNADGTYSRATSLSADEQKKLDQQNQLEDQNNQAALKLQQQGFNNLSTPFNYGLAPELYNAAGNYDQEQERVQNQVYGTYKKRLDDQYKQDDQGFEQSLADRGIPRNSERYNYELDQYNRQKNDAYDSANTNAISAGQAAKSQAFNQAQGMFQTSLQNRQQGIGEMLDSRGRPLTEMAGILAGNRGVNMPQFSQTPEIGYQAPDVAGVGTTFAGFQNQKDVARIGGSGGGGGGGKDPFAYLAAQQNFQASEAQKERDFKAAQIKASKPNPWSGIAGSVGAGIGSGLGQGFASYLSK